MNSTRQKSGIFKWSSFGLLIVVLAGAFVFVLRTNTFSSKIVLRDEIKEHRTILHNATGEHGCDCFSPMISYFNITSITSDGATFTWDCSQQSTYQVTYGLTASHGTYFPSTTPTTSYTVHSVTVTGLQPNTLYHVAPSSICKATSCVGSPNPNTIPGERKEWLMSNKTSQNDWTFTTLPAGATYSIQGSVLTSTGTGISGVTVTLSGKSQSTFTTTTPGTYQFASLATGNYTITPTKTNYTFNPANRSYASLGANQSNQNFTGTISTAVLNGAARAISEVAVAKITAKDVTITWKTNVPATSLIEYGLTTDYGMKSGVNIDMVFDHDIQLFELQPGATYHARAVSYVDDEKGTAFRSSDFTFKTPAFEDRIVKKEHIFNEPNPCATWTNFSYFCYQPLKRATIDILTLSGKVVASLESPSSALAEGWNKVRWDVKDNGGKLLRNGLYVYKMKFITTGNVEEEVKCSNLRVAR